MSETDYLRKGKQLEDLYRQKAKRVANRDVTEDVIDKICKTKPKFYFEGYQLADNCFLDLKDLAGKAAKYLYRPLLEELEQAKSADVQRLVIEKIRETYHESVRKDLVLLDCREEDFLPADVREFFLNPSWLCADKSSDGVCLKVSYQNEYVLGVTRKHKASRYQYCQLYFKKHKKNLYPVMDIGLYLGCLYLLNMMVLYLEEDNRQTAAEKDYVQLLAEKMQKDLGSINNQYRKRRARRYAKYGEKAIEENQKLLDQHRKEEKAIDHMIHAFFEKREIPQGCFLGLLHMESTRNTEMFECDCILVSALMHRCRNAYLERQYTRELSSDYARSFETKKNIPKSVLAYMEVCAFNQVFGYVEVDEDCDTGKIDVLWEQFSQFRREYFPDVDCSACSIRFRRLGNHHASGLYYPQFHCLCVDIAKPGSLVHEFGHLVDYRYGKLSLKPGFEKVLFTYQSLLRNMEKDSFSQTGKYTLSYYLTPTEVFARSLEMYLAGVEKLDADILSFPEGPAYPKDAQLDRLVKEYWDSFFTQHA